MTTTTRKIRSNGSSSPPAAAAAAPTRAAAGKKAERTNAGLWKLFPVLTVTVGLVLGILWGPAADSEADAVGKKSTVQQDVARPPKARWSPALHDVDVTGGNCGADQFLSPNHSIPGFHLACLQQEESMGDISLTLFMDGQAEGNQTLTLPTPETSETALHDELTRRLKLDEPGDDPPNKFPWAMFTPDGRRRIRSFKDAMTSRLVFIFKGGNFIWPGVEVGHVQTVRGLQKLGSIDIKTVSMTPLVFEAQNFLLDNECDHIKEKAAPYLKPSPVSLMDHDRGKADTNWRTSMTYFMPSTRDEILLGIDQRVEEFTRVPKSHQEQVQVLKYDKGQQYTAHHDFFNPKMYQKDTRTLANIQGGRKNRMVTVFWYLSDVEEGGETIFPRAGGRTGPVDFSDCTKGLKVKPRVGKVAMFYSLRPDGQFDDFSLHGACPVITGQKWAANKWVWSAPVSFG